MKKTATSIIIPTFGRTEHLKNLLESIRESTPPESYEIIVVSSDLPDTEKIGWLKEQKDINLIMSDSRKEGGKRKKSLYHYTNLGAYQAKNEWVFVINDDMLFDKKWYHNFQKLISDPKNYNVGMVIVATHLSRVWLGRRIVKLGWTQKLNSQRKNLYLSDFSFIRRDVLKQINYFDENLDWAGSGVDNSLNVEFLTNKETITDESIVINHSIANEHRASNIGNVFEDYHYLTNKWNKWCHENGCRYECNFGVKPYTLKNRIKNYLRKIYKDFLIFIKIKKDC